MASADRYRSKTREQRAVGDHEGAMGRDLGGSRPRDNGQAFSDHHRENRDTINPDTGERVLLLTKKQWLAQKRKELKDF